MRPTRATAVLLTALATFATAAVASAPTTAVAPDPTAPPPATCTVSRRLTEGDTGADVLCYEQRLAEHGFPVGPVDGVYDADTAQLGTLAAKRSFKLKADTTVTVTLLEKLGIWKPVGPATCTVSRRLVEGDRGSDVNCYEARLAEYGFQDRDVDDYYGEHTSADATPAAKKYFGLAPNGTATVTLLKKLGIWKPVGPATCTVSRRLVEGDVGNDVNCYEARLAEYGFLDGGVNRLLGAGTARVATPAAKKYFGLAPNGTATVTLLKKLGIWKPVGPATCTVSRRLAGGDRGSDVNCYEARLAEYGFQDRDVDDYYGEHTRADTTPAAKKYFGLAPNGTATVTLLKKLGIWKPVGPATCTVSRRLAGGDRGSDVNCYEARLAEYGFQDRDVDDYYGEHTRVDTTPAAKKYFGLAPDGTATVTLLKKLGIWKPLPPCSVSRELGYGMSGADVECYERTLRDRGFQTSDFDTYFGTATISGTRAAERHFGLSPDGVADAHLLTALGVWTGATPSGWNQRDGDCGLYPSGKAILIDKVTLRLWLCQDGKAASGLMPFTSGPTYQAPRGTYSVYFKNNPWWSAGGIYRLDHFTGFAWGTGGGRIGFHKYVLMQEWQVGTEAFRNRSGGCFRMRAADAATLFYWTPYGTTVRVLNNG